MVSRVEMCCGCGRPLQLPPQADAVQCFACQAVTRFRPPPSDRWATAYDMGLHAPRGRFPNVPHNYAPAAGRGNGMYPPRPLVDNNNYYMDLPQSQSQPQSQPQLQPQLRPRPRPWQPQLRPQLQPRPRPWQPQLRPQLQPRPRPTLAPPPVYGRRKALLCGVTYNNTNHRLSGSVNDVRRMRFLLVEKLGFPMESVVSLTEEEKSRNRIPTKQNIRTAMRWLVQDCQAGDSLVFHYSGHGSRQKDYNGDERDGFDETLCPLDHETEGPIIDDEINATIVRPLPHGAKLHAIFDSCYSGTLLDLPFVCEIHSDGFFKWEDQILPTACYKGTSGGIAFSFSACADNQTSASTSAFTGRYVTGCMTSSFIQAVENEPGLTYGRLLTAMRDAIPKLKQDNTGVFQEPQLSASETFDVHSKQVIL